MTAGFHPNWHLAARNPAFASMAAPLTGPYGSFFQGLPSGRMIQFVAKITF
jgi:hypothetical protein